MSKVGMVSLGCPKNQMDAELMLAKLREAGFRLTTESGLADVVIVNTCGFIEDAKREAIENILEFAQLKQEGQIKKIVVTGCLAQRYKDELCRELPECDAVLGLGANDDIVEVVREVLKDETVARFPDLSCWNLDGERLQTTPDFFAYLRIGDGCNNCCTYCAIPHIRGRLRSRDMDTIVEEAHKLVENGVKELVLVAQDTTLYGAETDGVSKLPQLLNRLCEIEGLHWIRLLYCYPEHITDELLDVMATEEKVAKYLDIPIQHASGRVLKAMNRPGDRASLTALMAHIRERVPDVVLRTTVMTGFPNETEEDFEDLCEFIKEVRFERLGCFAFSAEEGTVAATMQPQVPDKVREQRRDIVMELQTRMSEAYQEAQLGRTVEVLVESFDRYAECWFGRTYGDAPDIDGKVFFTTRERVAPGDIVQVKITDYMEWDLVGERI
ncbi:MAG: 30S ribosomal protein S12 methylthiotransferase RimO [Clostridia bacterium]|nr:30S ribosomal protein S12 methylthiotransferase RimO [Clostridia bacterium]